MRAYFKIGRGGRFYNGGHLHVMGIGDDIDLASIAVNELNLFPEDGLGLFDGNGRKLLDIDEWNKVCKTGCGRIDIDGEYNTVYVRESVDLDGREVKAIIDDDYYSDRMVDIISAECKGDDNFAEIMLAARIAGHFGRWEDYFGCRDMGMDKYEERAEEPEDDDVDYYHADNGKYYVLI